MEITNAGKFLLCGILIHLNLTACTTTTSATHVTSFANASHQLTQTTMKALDRVNSTTIERKLVELATLPPTKVNNLTPNQFFEVRGIYHKDKNSRALRALEALQNYVDALGSLSSADYRQGIDEASEKLYGSLNKMSNLYTELTSKNLGLNNQEYAAIATVFDGIGTAIIEEKRRAAIKHIVLTSNEYVAKLCDALSTNVGNDIDLVKINMDRVIRERIEAYKDRHADLTMNERMSILRKIALYSTRIEQLPKLFEDASTAAVKVKDAHQVLADELSQNKFTTAKLAKTVGELKSFSDHMRSHYKGLVEQ